MADGIGTVTLPGGRDVARLGQGTWRMGEDASRRRDEVASLRRGIELGMTVVDTAEMYGDGEAERVVGEAIRDLRDEVFLVSKVLPGNATRAGIARACRRSLERLGVGRIDLYLLHWRGGGTRLPEVVEAFGRLRDEGLIGRWGVSNLDVDDMAELDGVPGGRECAANQVLYSLEHRGIEHNLLPWSRERGMPVMAYSPVGQGGALLRAPAVGRVAEGRGATPAQVALAWTLRGGGVMAIPKTATPARVAENAQAAAMVLEPDELAVLDAAFPPPRRAEPLAML